MMRFVSPLIVAVLAVSCGPKGMGESASESSTSPEVEPDWAVGYYIRPGDGSPSAVLASIDVREDKVAVLQVQACNSEETSTAMVGWEVLNNDSITFVSLDESEPFKWFGSPPVGKMVTLTRTETEGVVLVTDGKTADHAYMGNFTLSATAKCLVLVDPLLGCADGAYAQDCPDS